MKDLFSNTGDNLFSDPCSDEKTEQQQLKLKPGNIDVVEMAFVEAQSMSWSELFSGFQKLYSITYSSGIGFIGDLLSLFDYAEIIFGAEQVMSFSLQEVMAHQLMFIERLRSYQSKKSDVLIERIKSGSLMMYVARERLSHEKIYLLEALDGRKRVVLGSANMSQAAFYGRQRENICFIDGDKAFDWYMECFEQLKSMSSDNISSEALMISDAEDAIQELPIMQTVRLKKALVLQPESNEEVRFVLNVQDTSKKLAPHMPKPDKRGKIILTPESIIQTRRRLADAAIQEKELRSEYPQLVIDVENNEVKLNGNELNLSPDADDLKNDIALLSEYMEGYRKFHGDVADMQKKYYAFANWMFVSPFMAIMRNYATKYNRQLLPYPVFGLVYGQSKAGKTSFLMTMLKLMIGQMPRMAAPEFTRTQIDSLKRSVQGAPIIVDDLTNSRFSQHAIETIKNDDFGVIDNLLHYPAVIISANEDVKAVAPEVIRRTVVCHVQGGLTNTEIIRSNVVRKVQKQMGTSLYREYLRRMLDAMPDLIEDLKDDDSETTPDILSVSAKILLDILADYTDKIPAYARLLTVEDYFSEKVTGSQAIKTIQRAWQVNRKAFEIDKKYGQLRYNAGAHYEVDRILKELPEDLRPQKSRDWLVMDLEKACVFFEIDFSKPKGWLRLPW